MIGGELIDLIKAHQAAAGLIGTVLTIAAILISGHRHKIAMTKIGANRPAVK